MMIKISWKISTNLNQEKVAINLIFQMNQLVLLQIILIIKIILMLITTTFYPIKIFSNDLVNSEYPHKTVSVNKINIKSASLHLSYKIT